MKWKAKVMVVVALAIFIAVVMMMKGRNCCSTSCPLDTPAATQPAESQPTTPSKPTGPLPRLVELGAHWCGPCRRMEPVLENLRSEYAGRMKVEFIDTQKNPEIARKYKVRVIPTQIFISADGKELHRHEGYISKEDILGWWGEFGVTFEP